MQDRDLKDGLKAAGYSLEEMWFYRQNCELLDEMRKKTPLSEQKVRPAAHLRVIPGGKADAPAAQLGAPEVGAVKKAA